MVGGGRVLKARIIWWLITIGEPYDEKKAFQPPPSSTARRLKHLQNQAKALNMTFVQVQ